MMCYSGNPFFFFKKGAGKIIGECVQNRKGGIKRKKNSAFPASKVSEMCTFLSHWEGMAMVKSPPNLADPQLHMHKSGHQLTTCPQRKCRRVERLDSCSDVVLRLTSFLRAYRLIQNSRSLSNNTSECEGMTHTQAYTNTHTDSRNVLIMLQLIH